MHHQMQLAPDLQKCRPNSVESLTQHMSRLIEKNRSMRLRMLFNCLREIMINWRLNSGNLTIGRLISRDLLLCWEKLYGRITIFSKVTVWRSVHSLICYCLLAFRFEEIYYIRTKVTNSIQLDKNVLHLIDIQINLCWMQIKFYISILFCITLAKSKTTTFPNFLLNLRFGSNLLHDYWSDTEALRGATSNDNELKSWQRAKIKSSCWTLLMFL